ncbi:PREDICTED: TNF receptor-associated factor 3-like [Amphimedon queenslandica]|uniref:RING-type E3 ubiquitin transferase n=1 Tax=Amphimedon queenslandica TaxID=400682 RepID=A0AAN0JP66_AMPQE|nr:PREDICTED: TNF receptor-associated factor 3-like [Amphimedon queenslandica]|eukprot:XP_019858590.1 PREDICTED: TNF receptor-associated factor 3-like [Amphimedon queenslandica]
MAQFSKEEFSFVKELPEHVEIECPVCRGILTDPHLVSCCGHNFCRSCIERVKASNGFCPMCKEKEYQAIPDKKCSRIINGLEVYCSNKEKGCEWKGELKNMSTHLNKEKREGECQYEKVKCRYEKCQERKQRRYFKDHEYRECPHRLVLCPYCRSKGTFLSITKDHYEECRQYPVTCPNKCSSTNMPRGSLTAHINECPLEPVDCVFSWAGCNDKPLRKDVHVHTADTNDSYPLLPVDVVGKVVHFYTNACGYHMSARLMRSFDEDYFVLLAFHEGKFDKFKPNFPKIFASYLNKNIPLIDNTAATYQQLPHNILNGIQWRLDTVVPEGVIKQYLVGYLYVGKYDFFSGSDIVTIYAQ